MAQSVAPDYGWFSPADVQLVVQALPKINDAARVVLVGGQSLTAWVEYFDIKLPHLDQPYLTQDADFLGTGSQATAIARLLNGSANIPEFDDHGPNTGVVVFTSTAGTRILLDFLNGIIGVSNDAVRKLAVPLSVYGCDPILVLHPLLVLESRCANLFKLPEKRNANGVTQAKVACQVVRRYLDSCLRDSTRRREALNAAKRIATLATSVHGLYVWKVWGIDVMETIEQTRMPGRFGQSWPFRVAEVARKREIAKRTRAATA